MYITLTFVLSLIGALVFVPKFKSVVEKQNVGVNFFLTLIATLVGVLLAIEISNYEAKQKEKQDVIKLLNSSITSVDTCHDYSTKLIEHFDSMADDDQSKSEFFVKNPPPYPEYLDAFLTQSIVGKNLSEASLSDLNISTINLKRSQSTNPTLYLAILEQTIRILQLEAQFQSGAISEHQLATELDKLSSEINQLTS